MSLKLKKIMKNRKGFTLVEVLLASLALATVTTILFGLTTSVHLTTLNILEKNIAQNIAQATLEDLEAKKNYQLGELIAGTPLLPNYPGGTSGGAAYHLITSAPILLDSTTNSSSDVKTDAYGRPILFAYTNNTFSRDLTITKLPTTPESYGIAIIVTWRLNLNSKLQSLTITGTKN